MSGLWERLEALEPRSVVVPTDDGEDLEMNVEPIIGVVRDYLRELIEEAEKTKRDFRTESLPEIKLVDFESEADAVKFVLDFVESNFLVYRAEIVRINVFKELLGKLEGSSESSAEGSGEGAQRSVPAKLRATPTDDLFWNRKSAEQNEESK